MGACWLLRACGTSVGQACMDTHGLHLQQHTVRYRGLLLLTLDSQTSRQQGRKSACKALCRRSMLSRAAQCLTLFHVLCCAVPCCVVLCCAAAARRHRTAASYPQVPCRQRCGSRAPPSAATPRWGQVLGQEPYPSRAISMAFSHSMHDVVVQHTSRHTGRQSKLCSWLTASTHFGFHEPLTPNGVVRERDALLCMVQ